MKNKSATSKQGFLDWLSPLLLAVLMFVCIRFAEDLPKGSMYWQGKSLQFFIIDFGGVVAACYFFRFTIDGWLALNLKWNIGTWFEYGMLIVGVFLLCITEMFVSWKLNGRMYGKTDIAVPVIVSILVICLFYGFRKRRLIKQDNEKLQFMHEQMIAEQLQTELKLLRAQFHPHFLFNALNTVYFQIDENNPKPRRTVELLSNLLRYQIYNEGKPVNVSIEVDFLNDYIAFCRMRSSDRLKLTFDIDENVLRQKIQPLLFLPLVENAFKYIGGDYTIEIQLTLLHNEIVFRIVNSTPDMIPAHGDSGVGLDNLRRRLSLLYPDRHRLTTVRVDNTFKAEMIIKP